MINKDLGQPTRLVEILHLPEVKVISLTFQEQTFTVKACPADIFDAFVSQYDDDIQNVDRQKWSIFQRWRMINFLLDQGILEVHDGQLLEVPYDESEENPSTMEEKPSDLLPMDWKPAPILPTLVEVGKMLLEGKR